MRPILPLVLLAFAAAALPSSAAAQRYARPTGDPTVLDSIVSFESGDELRITSYPRMGSGVEICGSIARGIQWGKMMFARTDVETNSALETVVTFPSGSTAPSCSTHRSGGGDWLVVGFTRTVRDEVGRIGRVPVGEVVLSRARVEGKRVTFAWTREGPFEVRSVTPAPDTLSPRRTP